MNHRILKFRIWDEKYHCWDNNSVLLYPNTLVLKQGRCIQQYTGVKDCYNKEIYEGDILQVVERNRPSTENKIYWQVKYIDDIGSFGVVYGNCFETFEDVLKDDDVDYVFCVVGNIFENQDLLK